jgi:hypothetical protein
LTDITGLELHCVRVIATTGDLKDTRLNPKGEPPDSMWLMGITRHLPFDPVEWLWASANTEVLFFNYTSKIGYQLGLSRKQQGSRLHAKLEALQLTNTEIKLATDLIWEDNKPAKLQFFVWQVASGGLFTGSRAIHLGFPGECKRCGSGLIETTEHSMSSCSHARKVWRWAQNIREALGLTRAMAWRELASGIKPGTRLHNGYQHHQEPPQAAWDVLRVALLWRIWCARCRTVFSREPCSIVEVCELAWKDTIYAGMARLRHLKTSSPSL